MPADKSKSMCSGCRDDYYNRPGNSTTGECWCYAKAKVVRRWRIHWWTAPTVPQAYTEVETLACHREPGQYAFHEQLPDFAIQPRRLGVDYVAF